MARVGGITRSRNFIVKAWFTTVDIPKIKSKEENLTLVAARKIIAKAKELAAVPTSPLAKGVISGKLVKSIGIGSWKTTKTTTGVFVRVDLALTPTTNGTSYAIYQERGTGKYGKYRRPIRSKRVNGWMVWMQSGKPYRSKSGTVRAKKIGTVYSTRRQGRKRVATIEPLFKQFATEVKGSKPKHYWRTATSEPFITEVKEKLKTDLAPLVEAAIKARQNA